MLRLSSTCKKKKFQRIHFSCDKRILSNKFAYLNLLCIVVEFSYNKEVKQKYFPV